MTETLVPRDDAIHLFVCCYSLCISPNWGKSSIPRERNLGKSASEKIRPDHGAVASLEVEPITERQPVRLGGLVRQLDITERQRGRDLLASRNSDSQEENEGPK